ncbi:PREDICTED: F-box/LRR-repeat/kelch-repeat protein At1g09650-like [Camelina sativa]|uniref:F-box/LRR-repeat/kelch-repeat protein At1g09650-like n=1 Tax=Camelina sativa TaxID=90675 RepID=A0ABM0WY09_CAMSA|nr:PREDICTED: F-box/LRR-repeat/kelch-repeat protein At1g09650-like [Camelina sativa]XP_010477785.1 PREDICTED: F-box/LRR-repeat/kelch-repeat protein At1g09650-like [Camelina sativa]
MFMKKKLRLLHMESLPHHVVEHILERAPAKSLLRFKAVSKQWKSTIESRIFQERQLKHRQQSGGPDVLMVSVLRYEDGCSDPDMKPSGIESLRTLVLGSSSSVKIPTPWENQYHFVSRTSCDGLVCLYSPLRTGFVVNPTTRWHRVLPLSNYQQLLIGVGEDTFFDQFFGLSFLLKNKFFSLGFGKDKFTGTCKPVWLYNSAELGLENATTCEVFDFSTNSWRYVTHPAPYRVTCHDPAYVDGSLYWFTDCLETQLLSLDLHTEAFQVICKAPFANVRPHKMVMSNLDNRLCVSTNTKIPSQDIWSFDPGNKTWDKIYSIDLGQTRHLDIRVFLALTPLALLDGDKKKNKKKKLLYFGREPSQKLAIHDPETQSYDVAFTADSIGRPVCYFQSLISV